MNLWKPLEHKVYRTCLKYDLKGKSIVLGLSGGADSVALFRVLDSLKEALSLQIYPVHVHHGESYNQQYRAQAEEFIIQLTRRFNYPLHLVKNTDNNLTTENELREFRWQTFRDFQSSLLSPSLILTAHHQDDLAETIFMNLWRGANFQGAQGFSILANSIFRPFYDCSKQEILEYLASLPQDFREDPSNQSGEPLRNFIRNELFPNMESKVHGGVSAFSRSMLSLASELGQVYHRLDQLISRDPISILRTEYLSLHRDEKLTVVAKMLQIADPMNFTHGQIEEIIKRLDNSQNEYRFSLSDKLKTKVWSVDAKRISLLI